MAARHLRGSILSLVVLVSTSGCLLLAPAHPAMDEDEVDLLRADLTRAELTGALGVDPYCLALEAGSVACEWHLSDVHAAHAELARAMGVGDRIGVVCMLPDDGGPRRAGSCTFHQRRSNRREITATPAGKDTRRQRTARDLQEQREEEARAQLEEPDTALAMVRLIGQLPKSCSGVSDGVRTCV